jgi:hypothetical protein
MNKTSGMGLLVFGIVLAVVGAIMRFAVKVHKTGFHIHTGGFILLIVGILAAVIGLVLLLGGSRSRSSMKETVQDTPGGEVRTQDRLESGPDV